ncbi:DUF3168 domain-containing protein [Caulobacter hibisci]|uniref:DUF3168 domain-containing protein n=1 Tax=Caulobacter hibisci TaxID=2035993 RepID=A0ABS0SUR9_9CAUL|nr:DUF3168 domain-containing protein [Caulobacter hibisci]
MARDASLWVRKALQSAQKADAAVAAIVGARVYGQNPPADPVWPFTKLPPLTVVPMRATGLDGTRYSIRISGFAKGVDDTEAALLGGAISACLDGRSIALTEAPWPARLTDIRWTGTDIIRDPAEATGWHAIVAFEGVVTA